MQRASSNFKYMTPDNLLFSAENGADTTPWVRIPEPIDKLETAAEYSDLVVAFEMSDRAFAQELALFIPEGMPVVEIGSGPGNQIAMLAQLRPDLRGLIGIDYNPEMNTVAEQTARKYGIEQRVSFIQGDMTRLPRNIVDQDAFVFSNTALHELRDYADLHQTFQSIAGLVGTNGGCYIRDLLLPANAAQAKVWRAEAVDETMMQARDLELFVQSQHAGFTLAEVIQVVSETPLAERGYVEHPGPPKSRYWIYNISPKRL